MADNVGAQRGDLWRGARAGKPPLGGWPVEPPYGAYALHALSLGSNNNSRRDWIELLRALSFSIDLAGVGVAVVYAFWRLDRLAAEAQQLAAAPWRAWLPRSGTLQRVGASCLPELLLGTLSGAAFGAAAGWRSVLLAALALVNGTAYCALDRRDPVLLTSALVLQVALLTVLPRQQ